MAWQNLHFVITAVALVAALAASAHAIIYKREPRSAVFWVSFSWLSPLVGPPLYLLLGVNRIRRRAARLFKGLDRYQSASHLPGVTVEKVPYALPPSARHLADLAAL